MAQTVRLLFPQWQGGVNPDYAEGADLLEKIVPVNAQDPTFTIAVDHDFTKELPLENGVVAQSQILAQMKQAQAILHAEKAEKVIVMGGDCAVSLAPFDYLKEVYQEKLGILWLDAHPDVADLATSTHAHEMVLANLLGQGAPEFLAQTGHFFQPEEVMLAGLIKKELRPMDQLVNELSLNFATPEELDKDASLILDWLKDNKIEKLAVHFDLDVLSPQDFRSIYPAEPYLESFDAAIGQMTLAQVGRILTETAQKAEIVGLSITEHLPWDAIRLRQMLAEIPIFNS